jgi:prepilin-type N-terminal cleavage/methylation domain-containing protein
MRNMALRKCNSRPMRHGGFTLIELLVVVSIIALLVSILLPALGKARFQARNTVCMTNMKSIATAIYTYAMDNGGTMPVTTEAPFIDRVYGNRTTPLILRDAKYMAISDKEGGVWRCPLELRMFYPHFLAQYYYMGSGAIGNPADWTYDGMNSSYAANEVYRLESSKCPWSYWAHNRVFVERKLAKAKHAASIVMFYDTALAWDTSADNPYQLFITWVTPERYDKTMVYSVEGFWRHKPDNYTPFGNFGFIDGHAAKGFDYADTCTKNQNYSAQVAAQWWSFDGSQ